MAPKRPADDEDSEESADPYKMTVVVRSDLRMSAGKLAAQVGHAVHDAVVACRAATRKAWEEDGSSIIVLQAHGDKGLRDVRAAAKSAKVAAFLQEDEGLTELASGSSTAIAVGPAAVDRVNAVTGRLDLYKDPREDEIAELRSRIREAEAELQAWRRRGAQHVAPLPNLQAGESWFARDLSASPVNDPIIPESCEKWSWEGDKSVLPSKWKQALAECSGDAAFACSSGGVLLRPWEAPDFDPDGMMFITHRSQTVGIVAALAAAPPPIGGDDNAAEHVGLVAGLAVQAEFRRRGVGRCLLRLCLRRHADLNRRWVYCALDRQSAAAGALQLLQQEGFQPVDSTT